MIPAEIADLVEKVEIKVNTMGGDYVGLSLSFPSD